MLGLSEHGIGYIMIYIYIILLHIFNGEDDHELLSIGMIIICRFFFWYPMFRHTHMETMSDRKPNPTG